MLCDAAGLQKYIRHALCVEVWCVEIPKKSVPKIEDIISGKRKNVFTTNQMKLLISRKPQFLRVGKSEFPQYSDDSIVHCYSASRHTALITQKYVVFYLTSGKNMIFFTSP